MDDALLYKPLTPFYLTRWLFLFSIALLLQEAGLSQTRIITPFERSDFIALTSYDSLAVFLRSLEQSPFIRVEEIAKSRLGRSLFAVTISSSVRFGSDASKTKILLFAQQHGDEPSGKEALLMLLARIASRDLDDILQHLDLIIVPQMNPDGAESRTRTTSDGIDLNRHHVLLRSPEVRALHDLFERWKPQVTLDIHEFSALNRSWKEAGMVKTADVQIGMLTNPNTSAAIRKVQHREIFPFIMNETQKSGYLCQEYIVGSPRDRIRHSTTDINDGRQSFGILGTFSFIQEGRNRKTLEENLQRRAVSQLAAIQALIHWCSQHSSEINSIVANERLVLLAQTGKMVALQMEHGPGSGSVRIPVFNLILQKDTIWHIQPYHDSVMVLKSRAMPQAYIVPGKDTSVIDLLRRHHVVIEPLVKDKPGKVEVLLVDSMSTLTLEEDSATLPYIRTRTVQYVAQQGDVLVRTNQLRSKFLTIVMEPESQWGLSRYKEFSLLLEDKKEYPIIRIP